MNWGKFQEEAFNLTEIEAIKINRQIEKEYKKAAQKITKKLENIYANILSGVKPEDYYGKMIERNRLETLLKTIRKDYSESSLRAAGEMQRALRVSFSNVYYRKSFASEWIVPELQMAVLPKQLINLAVKSTEDSFKKITKSLEEKYGNKSLYNSTSGSLTRLLSKNRQQELQRITSAITQNLIRGSSRNETIKEIQRAIGQKVKKNGKTLLTGARASAERIYRTESNRIMNMGSYAQSKYAESKGVDIKRRLSAVRDNRTRKQSASMDGQIRGIDKPFTYPNGATAMTPGRSGVKAYDINDRETVIDLVEGAEPKLARGRNPVTGKNEVFSYKDFDKWAKDNGLTKNIYGEVVSK